MNAFAFYSLSRGGKNRNKRTLKLLARHLSQGLPGREIRRKFGLGSRELDYLNHLAYLTDGWHDLAGLPPLDENSFLRAARWGLVLVKGFRSRRVALSDAGRLLLVLCASDGDWDPADPWLRLSPSAEFEK